MNFNKLIKTLLPVFTIFALTACSAGKTTVYHADEPQPLGPEVQVPQYYYVTEMEQNYPIPGLVGARNEVEPLNINPPREFE